MSKPAQQIADKEFDSMTLFLDSANLDDIAALEPMGVIRGITMNPTLLRPYTDDPLEHLRTVLGIATGRVMYQPTKFDCDPLGEALRAHELDPDRVVAKIPVTQVDLPVAAELVRRGVPVALTAALTSSHMLICEAVGGTYLIPYVDRAKRDPLGTPDLVRELALVRRGPVTIVAASIKSAAQAVAARVDGADVISAPATVIRDLISHPMSEEAARDFDKKYSSEGRSKRSSRRPGWRRAPDFPSPRTRGTGRNSAV
jgi:transaldolase